MARIAKALVDACLANRTVQEYVGDPELPMWSEEGVRQSPTVRIEFDEAIAIGGIGETLRVTQSKHWGDGPYILPLEPTDWFYPHRITYLYRENSRYNRRFEQRRRLKELLGRKHRKLVGEAKQFTKTIFLDRLTREQARAIRRILNIEPGTFWRAVNGRTMVPLWRKWVQGELDFG